MIRRKKNIKKDLYDDSKPLKEVIDKYLKALNIESELDEASIKNTWEKVMGTFIAQKTTRISLRNKVLFLKIDSSIIRSEIQMEKTRAIQLINQELKKEAVSEIILR